MPENVTEEKMPGWQLALLWLFLLGVVGGFLFSIAIFALPKVLHAMDSGHATADAAEITPAFAPASRNVAVKGRGLVDLGVRRNVAHRGRQGLTTLFFPLVPPSWKPDQPVQLIGTAEEVTGEQAQALATAAEFDGVLATAPLERIVYGLPDSVRDFLTTRSKLTIAPDVILLRVKPKP
jgi:hypothetical protein